MITRTDDASHPLKPSLKSIEATGQSGLSFSQQGGGQMSEQEIVWREPSAGFRFQPGVTVVSADHQRAKLLACGIDPQIHGDKVDPAFYIGLGIQAGMRNGISAQGNINMMSRLCQHRTALLDEDLNACGVIEAVTEVPRGLAVDTDAWFEDKNGVRVISVPRKSLRPSATTVSGRGAGERPAPVIADVTRLKGLSTYQLTPAQVRQYSSEGNSIHYEMAAANQAGFRAPIIGGGMGVHYLVAALVTHFEPSQFELDIYFRRPIFWDDEFQVCVDVSKEPWPALALVRNGKVLTEARVEFLV